MLTKKKQNTRRDLAESIHRIYRAGIFVDAGFIVGFDTEKPAVGDAMVDFIDDAAIPMAMVGLLYACPNTQLTRRLEKEGRLHANHGVMEQERATSARRLQLRDIAADARSAARLPPCARKGLQPGGLCSPPHAAHRPARPVRPAEGTGAGDYRKALNPFEVVHRIINAVPEARKPLWEAFKYAAAKILRRCSTS